MNSDLFIQNVYDVVEKIPFGRVTSYGAIAEFLGSRSSSRLVGKAMSWSHLNRKDLPAHRVVNRNGVLTGKAHFGNENEMEKLLEAEGIKVRNDQIIDFKTYFWDPNIELL